MPVALKNSTATNLSTSDAVYGFKQLAPNMQGHSSGVLGAEPQLDELPGEAENN